MQKQIVLKRIPNLHPGQRKCLELAKRFNVIPCGRRWGKSTFIVLLTIFAVLDNLKKGISQDIAVVGINRKNLAPMWRLIKRYLHPLIESKSEQDGTITIGKGEAAFKIEFWSMEALVRDEGMRGRAYRLVLVDEMGALTGFKTIWQSVIFATLNDYQGVAWFFGTPKGFNDFYEFAQYPKHELMKDSWMMYTAMSIENPHFLPSEWRMAQAQLTPEYFQQEYEAQFISLGNNLFNEEHFGILDELPDWNWKVQLRYWDIANSTKGDYNASIRFNVHEDSPLVIMDKPRRFRGKWGQTYPQIKAAMIEEPQTIHLIETEGIGSMAWEFILQDMAVDLAGLTIYPAGREYTGKSKWDRANAWAAKSNMRHFYFTWEKDRAGEKEGKEVINQISRFPYYANDEYVDSISGAHLGTIYVAGGFGTGKNPFITTTMPSKPIHLMKFEDFEPELTTADFLKKYPELVGYEVF